MPDILDRDAIEAALASCKLWHPAEKVAAAAAPIITAYRDIAPLGARLLALPPRFSPAHAEVFLLLRHLAETLGGLRPQARLVLEAFAQKPEPKTLAPEFTVPLLLARTIEHCDALEPVAALPETARSLFPLHLAQIIGAAQDLAAHEAWLVTTRQGADQLAAFLWKLAYSLELDIARAHLFDHSASEPGVLTLIDEVLGRREA